MIPATAVVVIDSGAAISELMDGLPTLALDPPSLFIDLEGERLSRNGSLDVLTLFVGPLNVVYLIDVHILRANTFATPGKSGKTLRDILESASIPKVFFDVRNDSDALYAHYNIALQGVQDVQLMENASRPGPVSGKRLVSGLARCIQTSLAILPNTKLTWEENKKKGEKLFVPNSGGSYDVFKTRPLHKDIMTYCARDVQFLPLLRKTYWDRLTPDWKIKVDVETRARVQLARDGTYQPHDSHKAFGPWQSQ